MATYEQIGDGERYGIAEWTTAYAPSYDAAYSPSGALRPRGGGTVRQTISATTQEAWFHFRALKYSTLTRSSNDPIFKIIDSAGNVLLQAKLTQTNNETPDHYIQYLDTTLQTHATLLTLNTGGLYTIDIRVVTGAGTGLFELYQDDTLLASATGLTNGTNPIKQCHLTNNQHTETIDRCDYYYSELLCGVGNSPTVGRRVFTALPTGDSATNTAWTGTFADVDELTSQGDGNFVFTGTITQRQGFTFPAMPSTNSVIEAVAITQHALKGSTSTLDITPSVRIGATDYDQSALGVITTTKPYETIMPLSPASGTNWTVSELNAAEFGIITT